MNMLEMGLYEDPYVTFKQEYRMSSLRRTTGVREGARKVEHKSILGDSMMNGVDSVEQRRTGLKSKVYSGMANHNNHETALTSEFSNSLRHVKEEILY